MAESNSLPIKLESVKNKLSDLSEKANEVKDKVSILGGKASGISEKISGDLSETASGMKEKVFGLKKVAASIKEEWLTTANTKVKGKAFDYFVKYLLSSPKPLVALAAASYSLIYLYFFVHSSRMTVKISRKKDDHTHEIVENCPSLFKTYWPTFFAPSATLQLLLAASQEVLMTLFPPPYTRERLTLEDGQDIALDWLDVKVLDDSKPVVILLHGAFQSSRSGAMYSISKSCRNAGCPVVVMNRRGYELALTQPKHCIFGFDSDLDEVLLAVKKRYPTKSVAIAGFSAGSIYAARYLSKRPQAVKHYRSGIELPRIIAGVSLDYGHDVRDDGAIDKMAFPFNIAVGLFIWIQYRIRHSVTRGQGTPKALKETGKRSLALDAFRAARESSQSFSDYDTWIEECQPVLEAVDVPLLIINSMDDPVVVHENLEAFRHVVLDNEHLVLLELTHGGHGPKTEFWGLSDLASTQIAEFVVQAERFAP